VPDPNITTRGTATTIPPVRGKAKARSRGNVNDTVAAPPT